MPIFGSTSASSISPPHGQYAQWMARAEDALALLILLDQFPRNAFRGSAHAYATDGLALRHAKQALASGFDQQVSAQLRLFSICPSSMPKTPMSRRARCS